MLRAIALAIAVVWFFRLRLNSPYLGLDWLPYSFSVGSWRWYYGPLATVLFGATAITIFVRELIRDQREKQRMAAELEAGRAVQQVLLGTEMPATPGLRIKSVYKPAGEVGGDFFQVIPASESGILLVVGDVSGKGLQAAMTVSAILGALRMAPALRPAELLTALNRILYGRLNGGLVTCCVVSIRPDGNMSAANAGHLSPYRNGEELTLPPGLPLGVASDPECEESAFSLNPGDTLTFISDGVVEARSFSGELFGFDRTAAMSTQSAEVIAEAAQAFGQEDDITVLTLNLTPAKALHA
ncbi:MAG: PP2C family protein-serine/threonine phosphatase [Acidobacteriaceae bacterium]